MYYRHDLYEAFQNIHQFKDGKILVLVNFIQSTTTQQFESNYFIELKNIDKGKFGRTTKYMSSDFPEKFCEVEDNCFITINEEEFNYNFPKS